MKDKLMLSSLFSNLNYHFHSLFNKFHRSYNLILIFKIKILKPGLSVGVVVVFFLLLVFCVFGVCFFPRKGGLRSD